MPRLTLEHMNQIIEEELEHIPEGGPRSSQNELRMAYKIARMHSLSKNSEKTQTAKEVLLIQMEYLRKEKPMLYF